jgi:glycerol kinase
MGSCSAAATGSSSSTSRGPAESSTPPPREGLLNTVAWQIGRQLTYAQEAAIFVTGAGVQWLRDGLGIIEQAAEARPSTAG